MTETIRTARLAKDRTLAALVLGCLALVTRVTAAAYAGRAVTTADSVDALGAIVGVWQSDVVEGRSALSRCDWTPQHSGVVCDQIITTPTGQRRQLNLFTFEPTVARYFLYVVAQPGGPSAPVPLLIEGTRWTYGGATPNADGKRIRTINDFSARDSYEWLTESTVDGEHWTRITGGRATRVAAPARREEEGVAGEIRSVRALLTVLPDKAAALFLLARDYARLGDLQTSLSRLRECLALNAGFVPDPDKSRSLGPLQGEPAFRELLAQARRRYASVHRARVSRTVSAQDLFPEGLAVDASTRTFYMGSMHHRKIVKFTAAGDVSDFVKEGAYDLNPVGGVHVDPTDHSVWASTDGGSTHGPELLHFDPNGRLLERYSAPPGMPQDLNDLALRDTTEIFTTDTEGNHVYRFDRRSHTFVDLKLWRPVFYPNGITLSHDGTLLFVADMLGVIRMDLRTDESSDVDPGARDTLSGIDGLYWHKGGLVGVQYGTGEYRVMRWGLSQDGRKVTRAEVLEYRSELVSDPTTGAILGNQFYFIANTGIYNLVDDRIADPAKLEPVRIAVVPVG